MVKHLAKNPKSEVDSVIKDKFKFIKSRYKINLDSVLNKSLDRALDVGVTLGGDKAKKGDIKNKLNALKLVMLDDIDKIESESSQNVARVIATSYAHGTPVGKIGSQLSDELGGIDYKTDRALRTNITYLSSLSKLKVWEEQGFSKYYFILGKDDSVTRPRHKRAHMKVFSIKMALKGLAPVPGHWMEKNGKINLAESINCRCSVRLAPDDTKVSKTY